MILKYFMKYKTNQSVTTEHHLRT